MVDERPFVQITPFFGVGDMAAAIDFYRRTLGFAVFVDQQGYAYVEQHHLAIRLLALDRDAANPPGCGHAYVDVRDLDALFAGLEGRLAALAADRWAPPKDHAYGQREFWVRDPDGNLLTFGQGIGANADQWAYRDTEDRA